MPSVFGIFSSASSPLFLGWLLDTTLANGGGVKERLLVPAGHQRARENNNFSCVPRRGANTLTTAREEDVEGFHRTFQPQHSLRDAAEVIFKSQPVAKDTMLYDCGADFIAFLQLTSAILHSQVKTLYIRICIHIYTYTHINIYVYINMYMCMYMYVYMYICMRVYIFIYTYIYIYINLHMYVHICTTYMYVYKYYIYILYNSL